MDSHGGLCGHMGIETRESLEGKSGGLWVFSLDLKSGRWDNDRRIQQIHGPPVRGVHGSGQAWISVGLCI